jgi:hypothetical protein
MIPQYLDGPMAATINRLDVADAELQRPLVW